MKKREAMQEVLMELYELLDQASKKERSGIKSAIQHIKELIGESNTKKSKGKSDKKESFTPILAPKHAFAGTPIPGRALVSENKPLTGTPIPGRETCTVRWN